MNVFLSLQELLLQVHPHLSMSRPSLVLRIGFGVVFFSFCCLMSCTTTPALPCDNNKTKCGSTCHDTATDVSHCGSCGKACQSGEQCLAGVCSRVCKEGQVQCEGACADVQSNPFHCGKCGNQCKKGESCEAGVCSLFCPEGTNSCNGKCVDLQNNPSHCGACGTTCESPTSCVEGVCTLRCPTGTSVCGNVCADLNTNPTHCGQCQQTCQVGEACQSGRCETVCPTGQVSCGGKCVALASDRSHCGACDKACQQSEVCSQGACALQCQPQLTNCAGACVNLQESTAHCGTCGASCQAGETCQAGACVALCQSGETKCAGVCVDLATHAKNCGTCGNTCPTDFGCCARSCVALQTDSQNCGACGNVCSKGRICTKGACVCSADQLECSGSCVDPQSHRKHCGGCGKTCASDQVCVSGKCSAPWALQISAYSPRSDETSDMVKVDAQGNVYLLGRFNQTFAIQTSTLQQGGVNNLFVAKFDSQLKIQWLASTTGAQTQPKALALDSKGNVHVMGTFASNELVFGPLSLQYDLSYRPGNTRGYENRAFVAQLDTTGKWKSVRFVGSQANTQALGLVIDSKDHLILSGTFQSGTTSVVFGGTTLKAQSVAHFVAKLDTNGTWLWAKLGGGVPTLDGKDNIYLAGAFRGSLALGSTTLTAASAGDLYVAKINAGGVWQWALSTSGAGPKQLGGVAVDPTGNVYITGSYEASATFGTSVLTSQGASDMFVAKVSSLGQWSWALSGGGKAKDTGTAIDVDSQGNVFVSGAFYAIKERARFGTFQVLYKEGLFLASLDPLGKFRWFRDIVGVNTLAKSLCVSASGSIHLTGEFIQGIGLDSVAYGASTDTDFFLFQIDSTGKAQRGAHGVGRREALDRVEGVAQDSKGNLYVVGAFNGFLAFGSTTLVNFQQESDLFVAKLSPSGTWLWVVKAGAQYEDVATAIAIDANDNIYVTGRAAYGFFGAVGFPSVDQKGDLFVAKISTQGKWEWVAREGGFGDDQGHSIHPDAKGNVYVVGRSYFGASQPYTFVGKLDANGGWQWKKKLQTQGGETRAKIALDTSGNALVVYDNGVTKFDPQGTILWDTKIGTGRICASCSVAVDANNQVYVAGSFVGSLPLGVVTLNSPAKDSNYGDLFVIKLNAAGAFAWTKVAGGPYRDKVQRIRVDAGSVYLTGSFEQSAIFGATSLTGATPSNTFIAKLDSSGTWQWAESVSNKFLGLEHTGRDLLIKPTGELVVVGTFAGRSIFGKQTLDSLAEPDSFLWLLPPK